MKGARFAREESSVRKKLSEVSCQLTEWVSWSKVRGRYPQRGRSRPRRPRFHESTTPRFLNCRIETAAARDNAARSERSYLPIFFDSSFPQNQGFCDNHPFG